MYTVHIKKCEKGPISKGMFEVSLFYLIYENLWGKGEALHPCDSCPWASGEGGSILWQFCPQTRRVAGRAEAMPDFLKVGERDNPPTQFFQHERFENLSNEIFIKNASKLPFFPYI